MPIKGDFQFMWLLSAAVHGAFEQAQERGVAPTAEQQLEYEARFNTVSAEAAGSRILTVAGNNAQINVEGVLTDKPSLMAFMFGGGNSTYSEIIEALTIADKNDAVESITLNVDSPGGTISGLFDTIGALQAVTKPVNAFVSNMAASAAYALVSQADTIQAANRATQFGSVGVKLSARIDESIVEITSTDSPNKAPDLSTAQGQAIVREELDALYEVFVDAIAEGRNTNSAKVSADFGQGSIILAEEALKRGMIDAVKAVPSANVNSEKTQTAQKGNDEETIKMDQITLQTKHAGLYAQVVEEGVQQERDRVAAHLIMGDQSGDMKTAIEAINNGSVMTAALQATYMAAGMNRKDIQDRQEDTTDATVTANNGEDGKDIEASAQMLRQTAEILNIEVGV